MATTPEFETIGQGKKIAAIKTKDGYALVPVDNEFVPQTDKPLLTGTNFNEFVNKITQYYKSKPQ